MKRVYLCSHCGLEVDAVGNGTYYLVKGWAQRRASGGANAITMAEELGSYLHSTCMLQIKRGVSKGQAAMFA